MTVSALVVTLLPEPGPRRAVLDLLAGDPRLTLGEPIVDRLPLVAETRSCADGEALVRELEALGGVARIDVIAIDFSEEIS